MLSEEEYTNKVLCKTCEEFMMSLPDNTIDLTVTSPPYLVGIEYTTHDDSSMTYDDYIKWLDFVWTLLYRVMKEHSYVAINIGRNSERNTPAHFAVGLESAGFQFYKSLVWRKPQGASVQTCWYKYPYPRYYEPYLVTEDVLIYSKGEVKGEFRGEKIDCLDPDFVRNVSNNVWNLNPDSHKVQQGIHPAPFPLELPARLIQLFSIPGQLVYDPFAGSGTTLLAAKQLGRNYVGTDIDGGYCDYARESLSVESLWG